MMQAEIKWQRIFCFAMVEGYCMLMDKFDLLVALVLECYQQLNWLCSQWAGCILSPLSITMISANQEGELMHA